MNIILLTIGAYVIPLSRAAIYELYTAFGSRP
jgi:hypothetical protein